MLEIGRILQVAEGRDAVTDDGLAGGRGTLRHRGKRGERKRRARGEAGRDPARWDGLGEAAGVTHPVFLEAMG